MESLAFIKHHVPQFCLQNTTYPNSVSKKIPTFFPKRSVFSLNNGPSGWACVKIQHVSEDKPLWVNVQKDLWPNLNEVSLLLIKKRSVSILFVTLFCFNGKWNKKNTLRPIRVPQTPGLEEKRNTPYPSQLWLSNCQWLEVDQYSVCHVGLDNPGTSWSVNSS